MTQLRRQTIDEITNVVSTDNSSTTTLGASGVFTGPAEDITNYAGIFVTVAASHDGVTDGCSIQQSSDGTNWDHTDDYSILAAKHKNFNFNPHSNWFRIVYTNGSTPQTYFRLQTIFKQVFSTPSSVRIQDDITSDDDAQLIKSVISMEGVNIGSFKNIGIQHPMPINLDSVYTSDLDIENCDNNGFSGSVSDYFDSLLTVNTDSTSNNPKSIKLWFKRTMYTNAIGFGCNDLTKSFSNIKLSFLGSGEAVRGVVDHSTDNEKRNSYLLQFAPVAFNGVLIEFHTADEVCLSNLTIQKESQVQARIKAQKDSGEIIDIGATNNSNLRISVQEYGDTPAIDAFARLRISEPFTIFDSKQLHDKQPLFWDEELGGSATSVHTPVDADVKMSVTAASGDYVIRQTKQRFNYQPGKGQLIFFTFHSEQETGLTKRIGLFDGIGLNSLTPNNGIFLEVDGEASWNICKDGTITETAPLSAWNVDIMDGTGASGIVLDFNAAQIGIIDYEWLGVGRVRVGFVVNGLPYYVHYFNHANVASFHSVYMSTPNLPLRYSIETDGTNAGVLSHICASVISEGGIEKTGVLRSVHNGSIAVEAVVIGTTYALLGLRLKSTHLDITIIPESISIACISKGDFRWSLLINPIISGTFTYSDLVDSSCQSAVGVTTNIVTDPGLEIASGYATDKSREADDALNTALTIGSSIAGVRDTLVLAVTPLDANEDVLGAMNFRELL